MPAAGRVIFVDADRLVGWVQRFGERHGKLTISPSPAALLIVAADGARAEIAIPYGPLPAAAEQVDPVLQLAEHVAAPRTIGILLVRRGGWAVGVVDGGGLVAAKTGGSHVQGRTKAGGWSQQRYARRRGNQTEQVWQRAADGAAEVLLPHRASLTAVVCGGDRAGVAAVLADSRLSWLAALVEHRFLAVPDPKRSVLDDVAHRLTGVLITLNERA